MQVAVSEVNEQLAGIVVVPALITKVAVLTPVPMSAKARISVGVDDAINEPSNGCWKTSSG